MKMLSMNNNNELNKIKIVLYMNAILSLEIFFAPVMIAFYLNYIGLTFNQMSLFFSFIIVLNIIFEIPSGALSDLIGRKKSFILGKLIYLFAMLSLILIQNLDFLVITALLFSIGNSLSSGNLSSIIYKNLSYIKKEKSYYFILSSKSMSISLISSGIASIIGGYLGVIDLRIPLIMDIVFLLFNLLIVSFFLIELDANYNQKISKFNNIYNDFYNILLEALKVSIYSKKIIFIFIFSALLFSLARVGFNFYQPMFEALDINLYIFGYILFSFNIIAAISAHFISKLKEVNINFILILTVILLIFSIICIYISNFAILLFFAFSFHQIIRGYISTYSQYYLNEEIHINHKSRTTILSFQNFFNALLCSITMGVSGFITSLYGMKLSLLILTIFVLLSIIFFRIRLIKASNEI